MGAAHSTSANGAKRSNSISKRTTRSLRKLSQRLTNHHHHAETEIPDVAEELDSRITEDLSQSEEEQEEEEDEEEEEEDKSLPAIAGLSSIVSEGFLHSERVQSYYSAPWPWHDPTKSNCVPEEMAMAGFFYNPVNRQPMVQCYACDYICSIQDIKDVRDIWDYHSERSPGCPHINLGRRKMPSDYSLREILTIYFEKIAVLKARVYCDEEERVLQFTRNLEGSVCLQD